MPVLTVACLLLHVWAELRPISVFVRTTRPMTTTEKAALIQRGVASAEMLQNMQMSVETRFDGFNAGAWTFADIRSLKRLLAWYGFLPMMPKRIEIDPQIKFDADYVVTANAFYKQRRGRQNSVGFVRRNQTWKIYGASFDVTACGPGPTTSIGRLRDWLPFDLSGD
jgi:hypothetical protein